MTKATKIWSFKDKMIAPRCTEDIRGCPISIKDERKRNSDFVIVGPEHVYTTEFLVAAWIGWQESGFH